MTSRKPNPSQNPHPVAFMRDHRKPRAKQPSKLSPRAREILERTRKAMQR